MQVIKSAVLGAVAFFALTSSALSEVVVRISKQRQAMYVYVDGRLRHSFWVSTGAEGYNTPNGVFRPTTLERFHRSSRYHNAPMPYSIFFRGGYAIHGSYEVERLGRPASHGCIRLHPEDARELYDLVQDYGPEQTRIIVSY
jgi:lipoprotein-anchoring transpeptidase ErfK/SrfK